MPFPSPLSQIDETLERIAKTLPDQVGSVAIDRNVLLGTLVLAGAVTALIVVLIVVRLLRGAYRGIDDVVNKDLRRSADVTLGRGVRSIAQLPLITDRVRAMTNAPRVDVVKLVTFVLQNAVGTHASDIHFDPKELYVALQYRIDGVLYDVAQFPRALYQNVVTRLKVLGNLKTYVKDTPQDGRVRTQTQDGGHEVDLRISVMPTLHGEKIVLRVLQQEGIVYDLEDLGFAPEVLTEYRRLTRLPQGICFLTGPTGSGKTTTVYSTLKSVKDERGEMAKLVTIEDPIEFDIDFLTQTQVNEAAGFTFAKGLRSMLRQDPDVIMLGEIRDLETAQIAIQAGLTGHLLFTSVHANSASGVFSRLINMGIEPFLLSSASIAILSQRLVRKLCPSCRHEVAPTDDERAQLARAEVTSAEGPFFASSGCEQCLGKGFLGRIGLYELLTVSDAIREAVMSKTSTARVEDVARADGMRTLLDDGLEKARRGVTGLPEVLRVALS